MPFTPSHVAAVLPFLRSPLPTTGLVIGSMVPDLPYFAPIPVSRDLTHSWLRTVLADLPMGLVVFGLWIFVFQTPLRDFAPGWIRQRLSAVREPRVRAGIAGILLIVSAILVGVVTHLLWDSFTHPDGWVVQALPAFQRQLGPFTMYRWAQYGSSAVGLVILLLWLVLWVRRTPAVQGEHSAWKLGLWTRRASWFAVIVPGMVVGIVIWVHGLTRGLDPFDRVVVFRAASLSIACAGLVAVVLSLLWYALPWRRLPDARERA